MSMVQSVRGMNDILPDDIVYWHHIESLIRDVTSSYAYRELRTPILEQTALFKRSIGDVTDIIEKEMYTFDDRNGDSLSLRPEGTACCVRAAIEHGLLHNQQPRLWYMGPMFRHERPQKGRYRQFYQLGVEAFGMVKPEADVEVILVAKRIIEQLGLLNDVTLQINTLGTLEARAAYREQLIAYYNSHFELLDDDSKSRLDKNPLRILDSKNPEMQTLNHAAPKLIDYLDDASKAHFDRTCDLLTALKIPFVITPTLVRGLDYYCHTVFEWVTTALGAQGTVCAGGRYDYLVEQLGGRATPAVGFAMGLERMVLLLQEKQKREQLVDVFFVLMGDAALTAGLALAERLRAVAPQLRVEVNCMDASFKSQLKRADKSGARYAIVLGDDELARDVVILKDLREQAEQQELTSDELIGFFVAARAEG